MLLGLQSLKRGISTMLERCISVPRQRLIYCLMPRWLTKAIRFYMIRTMTDSNLDLLAANLSTHSAGRMCLGVRVAFTVVTLSQWSRSVRQCIQQS